MSIKLPEKACGNCSHWHEWSDKKKVEHDAADAKLAIDHGLSSYFSAVHCKLRIGDCDLHEPGTPYDVDENGMVFTFDGYAFEDEIYDDNFNCFVERS